MAWSSAINSGDERVAFDEDIPSLLADHAIRDGGQLVERWNTAGTTAAADATDSDWPIEFARDGWIHAGHHTRPNATASTWFMVYELAEARDFDTAILIGSNLSSAARGTVQLQIDDSGTFPAPTTVHTFATPAAIGGRVTVTKLDHTGGGESRTYSDVIYLRLRITGTAFQPRVRELWLGKRRQLLDAPLQPYSDKRQSTLAPVASSRSGVRTQWVHHRGAGLRELAWEFPKNDQASTLGAFWSEAGYGRHPFWLIDTPESDPRARLFQANPAELIMPQRSASIRTARLNVEEQAPFLDLES